MERAVALVNEAGDRPAIAFTTFYSGLVALLTGRLEAACDLFARCAAMAAELGLAPLSARARQMLGYPLLDLGELPAARTALAEGFRMSMDVGDRWFVQLGLGGFVGLAVKTGTAPAGAAAGRSGRGVPGRERVLHARTDAGDRRPLARADRVPAPGGRPGGCSRRAGS